MYMKKVIPLIIVLPLVDILTHTKNNMVILPHGGWKDMLEILETLRLILREWLILKKKFHMGHPYLEKIA